MKPEDVVRIKKLLPTTLGTDEIREQIAADILRSSIFSARMASSPYLAKLRDVCADYIAGRINQASAVATLTDALAAMGHSPLDGGGLTNPASLRRLKLILSTQRQMAASAANILVQTPGTLDQYPAWELTRFGSRRVPREDWDRRWRKAGEAVGWQGALKGRRMIALKGSPIWAALGDGAGGFRDTLRNPFPPFAYSSGLAWLQVPRAECERLGLIGDGDTVEPPKPPTLAPSEQEIADAAERTGFADLFKDL